MTSPDFPRPVPVEHNPPGTVYPSVVRTLIPIIVSYLAAWGAQVGLSGLETPLTALVGIVLGTVYYAAARWLEGRYPTVGRFLLSAGLTKAVNPEYSKAA